MQRRFDFAAVGATGQRALGVASLAVSLRSDFVKRISRHGDGFPNKPRLDVTGAPSPPLPQAMHAGRTMVAFSPCSATHNKLRLPVNAV